MGPPPTCHIYKSPKHTSHNLVLGLIIFSNLMIKSFILKFSTTTKNFYKKGQPPTGWPYKHYPNINKGKKGPGGFSYGWETLRIQWFAQSLKGRQPWSLRNNTLGKRGKTRLVPSYFLKERHTQLNVPSFFYTCFFWHKGLKGINPLTTWKSLHPHLQTLILLLGECRLKTEPYSMKKEIWLHNKLLKTQFTSKNVLIHYGSLRKLTQKNYHFHFIIKRARSLLGVKGELWSLCIYDDNINIFPLVKIFQPFNQKNVFYYFNFKLLSALERKKPVKENSYLYFPKWYLSPSKNILSPIESLSFRKNLLLVKHIKHLYFELIKPKIIENFFASKLKTLIKTFTKSKTLTPRFKELLKNNFFYLQEDLREELLKLYNKNLLLKKICQENFILTKEKNKALTNNKLLKDIFQNKLKIKNLSKLFLLVVFFKGLLPAPKKTKEDCRFRFTGKAAQLYLKHLKKFHFKRKYSKKK